MTDRFFYFAYGSNMLTARLRERTPSAMPIGAARLPGRQLAFDKRSHDGSGKCDIERASDRALWVHGVLYEIARDDLAELDRAEGLGSGYERDEFEIDVPGGSPVLGLSYVATHKQAGLLPYCWYRSLVIAGAVEHRLPQEHVTMLRATPFKPDPDTVRRKRHERFFRGFAG